MIGAGHPAVEVVAGTSQIPLALTCEHASNALPQPWSFAEVDRWLAETHWAWDPGAADLTREVARRLGAPAVLARFSRLLIDPNRPLDSPTLFRNTADGLAITFNTALDDEERRRRIDGFWRPYHAATHAMAVARRPRLLVSIHTFTPVYEGTPRAVELGVLHGDEHQRAERWRHALAQSAYDVRINEPYSGAAGLMYSVETAGTAAGCPAIEIEVRNDLLADPTHFQRIAALICGTATGELESGF